MSFEYPLGLLGLIGVPIVILIYILKNKYTEQIIASTYLWNLSEKFLKKRKKVSLISGIISLLLQIITIVVISLLISHPILTIPNSAKEYCFILDGSGSMMIEDEITRFEKGKDEVESVITSSTDGSLYTLVYVGDTTKVVYEKLGNKEKACELLNKLNPSGVSANYNSALKYVQGYFNENNSLVTYLVTDNNYSSKNIEILDLSNLEENYAITEMNVERATKGININGTLMSYKNDVTLNLEIYVNGSLIDTLNVEAKKNEKTSFTVPSTNSNYSEIKAVIKNADSLALDNQYICYNLEKEHSYKTLIVSERPFYIQSVIETVGNTVVKTVNPSDYDENVSGYDLYIFDVFAPSVLPKDGTIWFFGVTQSVEGSGFSVQDVVTKENGVLLTHPKNSTTLYKTLTKGLMKDEIYVSEYIKYGLYRNFTVLYTYDGSPMIFTGISDYGFREVVFAFDLHNSNITLLMDYLVLTKNLLDYSFPTLLETANYVAGEDVLVNVLSNCESIRVTSPSNNISYLDVSKEVTEFKLKEVGTYSLLLTMGNSQKEIKIFSSLPSSESESLQQVEEISLQGELGNSYRDGIYDKLIILFIILAIVYVADWMVYCYEQYQLR